MTLIISQISQKTSKVNKNQQNKSQAQPQIFKHFQKILAKKHRAYNPKKSITMTGSQFTTNYKFNSSK